MCVYKPIITTIYDKIKIKKNAEIVLVIISWAYGG